MNDNLSALPTPEAIKILSSDFRRGKYAYVLFGSNDANNAQLDLMLENSTDKDELSPYAKFIKPCDAVSVDVDEAVLYECSIDIAKAFNFYTYAIALVKLSDDATLSPKGIDIAALPKNITLISVIKIAKTAFIAGVGGNFKFKLAVLGKKCEVLFQNESNFLTLEQAQIFYKENIKPQLSLLNSHVELSNTLIKKGII